GPGRPLRRGGPGAGRAPHGRARRRAGPPRDGGAALRLPRAAGRRALARALRPPHAALHDAVGGTGGSSLRAMGGAGGGEEKPYLPALRFPAPLPPSTFHRRRRKDDEELPLSAVR